MVEGGPVVHVERARSLKRSGRSGLARYRRPKQTMSARPDSIASLADTCECYQRSVDGDMATLVWQLVEWSIC